MSRKSAVEFLRTLAQALSAMSLYEEGHPARSEALDDAHAALGEHLAGISGAESQFSFLDGEVIHEDRQIRELRDWPWSRLLPDADVDRIEFEPGVQRSELVRLLETVRDRLDGDALRQAASGREAGGDDAPGGGETAGSAAGSGIRGVEGRADIVELPHLRFGPIRRGEGDWGEEGEESEFEKYGLDEELEAVKWLMEEAGRDGAVSGVLAGAVVKSISVALHEEQDALRLLAPLKASDEYTTVHSMNAATLSMGLGEALGLTADEVHTLGQAALLHDTGKTKIPEEILKKEGELTDEEWEMVREHPREGARILMNSDEDMEIPALVAYEHHLWWDGSGGYPELRYPRKPHPATQIVHVCDFYDALRTERPYRSSWEEDRVESYLREQAGTEFHPGCVDALLDLLERDDEAAEADEGPDAAEARSGEPPTEADVGGGEGPPAEGSDAAGREEDETLER